jgi:hypothetical protein
MADTGVAAAARAAGYNAVFATDHDRGSSFQISSNNGNYVSYSETLTTRWKKQTSGSLSGSSNSEVATPLHSGTKSLRVSATSSSTGGPSSSTTAVRRADLVL